MYRLHLLRIFRSINATVTDYVLCMYPETRTPVVSPSINIEWKSLGDVSRVPSLVALKGLQRVRRGGGEVGSTKARDKLQNPGGLCKTRNAQTAERHPERSGKGIPERASERRNFAARLSPPSTGVCLSPLLPSQSERITQWNIYFPVLSVSSLNISSARDPTNLNFEKTTQSKEISRVGSH